MIDYTLDTIDLPEDTTDLQVAIYDKITKAAYQHCIDNLSLVIEPHGITCIFDADDEPPTRVFRWGSLVEDASDCFETSSQYSDLISALEKIISALKQKREDLSV